MKANILLVQFTPGLTLISGVIVLAILLWLFWPERGIIARLSQIKMNNERVLLEDALKYLFDCEYRNSVCGLNSIAGNLNISVDKAGDLIERLLSLELINMTDQSLSLTDTGRSYALRVIRVHRIWERYLADETSVAQADWHNKADQLEHHVTSEQTEKLAAQMGNPVFDPHGDPIPTLTGEIPEPKGILLNHMKEGETGRIIHIEDEPRSIYEQLSVQGLYPGMNVYVADIAENKIVFIADGDEFTLTPLFASHITVEQLSVKAPAQEKHELLSALDLGESAEIVGISPNCRGQQRRRLMDMGIVPGSPVSAVIRSSSGDPVGYRIMGTTIGIRKQQADLIFIKRKKEKEYEHAE